MKTSLGIWAFGGMATRVSPGGYKPELAGISTVTKVRTAVEGLGDLMDDYEFHYPWELSPDNLDEVREALDGHGIYCIASGLHLDPRFGKGAFCSPDDALRNDALRLTREAIDLAAETGAHLIIWPGIEGYNYPFQTPYAESWARFIDGIGESAAYAEDKGVTVFLEHKNSEPAMKILMRNVGMTLHVIHTLRARGISNVKVNMDWQHLIMNGENLAEYAALLAAEGLLGHQHANSGWGTFDDDNMVGATGFMETLELALELRRADYGQNGERLGFDLYPYTEDAVGAVKRSVLQWRFIDGIAANIDEAELRRARDAKDAVGGHEPELYGRVRHVLLPKDYVRLRLTGELAVDVADASGTLLFDVRRRAWSEDVCAALDIPLEWLPPAHESTEIAGAGDQAAAALGVGIARPGPISVVLGTSGVVFSALPAYEHDRAGRLHAFCHAVPETWQAMGVMLSAAGSAAWLRGVLDAGLADLEAEAAAWPPGSEGLLF